MCGIFGVCSGFGNVNPQVLSSVSKLLKHRGPDDEGYLLANLEEGKYQTYAGDNSVEGIGMQHISEAGTGYNLAFLHRRLSIIDISRLGHQPMSYNDGELWITYNGGVYNYIELRAELITRGYRFISNGDSEVILAAYQEWGTQCVTRFNGMFAFAIFDRRNNTVFLSRDRLGIKPLYYYSSGNTFAFSSEIKGVLGYLKQHIQVDDNKIREYLVKGSVIIGESDKTMFVNIFQLLPAHSLVYRNGETNNFRYWDLEVNIRREPRETALRNFSELFHDSIKLMLRSDVEVGTCLSGGIDSSSIVSYASSAFSKRFNTFSAIWPGTRHDEKKYMKLVNERYSAINNYVEADLTNLPETIDELTWHQEIPVPGSSLLAQWNIMKKARETKVPVLLDGQGADEILSGYPFYLLAYLNEMFVKFRLPQIAEFLKYSSSYGFTVPSVIKLQVKRIFGMDRAIVPRLPISGDELGKYHNSLKYQYPQEAVSLPDFLIEHITKSNLPALLHFEDRNSMAHSIEARVPYLDHRLVEFCINIPSEQKIGRGFTKTILRDAMKDYVPAKILERRDKIGFSTPVEENIAVGFNGLDKSLTDYLMNSELWKSGLIDKAGFRSKDLLALFCLDRFLVKYGRSSVI